MKWPVAACGARAVAACGARAVGRSGGGNAPTSRDFLPAVPGGGATQHGPWSALPHRSAHIAAAALIPAAWATSPRRRAAPPGAE